MKLFLFITAILMDVMFMNSMAFAGPRPGQERIIEIMRFARDPDLTRGQKIAAAQKGLDYIRAQVGDGQLKTITEDTFKDPDLEKKLGFYETKGLGAVYTEFNQLIRDIHINDTLNVCHSGKGNHSRAIQEGMGQADPCSRGQVTLRYAYYNSKKQGDVTVYQSKSPIYAYSEVSDIVQISSLGRFFDEKNDGSNPFKPTLDQVKKANPEKKKNEDLNGVAAVSELRGKIYREAIQREIQNKLSLDYRYAEPVKTTEELKALAEKYIKNDCKHCTQEMTEQIKKTINKDLQRSAVKGNEQRNSIQKISENLCAELRNQGYWFEPERKAHEMMKSSSIMPLYGNYESSMELTPGQNLSSSDLLEKNKRIMISLSQKGNDYALLLTDALTKNKSDENKDVQMKCTTESREHDQALIREAFQEAKSKTAEFAKNINDQIHPDDHSAKTQTKDIEHLVKFAPAAVGIALQDSEVDPAMAGFVCGVLTNVESEKRADSAIDGAVMWGGMLVGGVATIATGGMAAPFFYAGLATSVAVNVATTYYSWDKSGEAHELANHYAQAAIAQGGDPALMKMSEEEFEKFKQYRFDAILSGAFTVGEVASLISIGARSGKSLATINRELREATVDQGREIAVTVKAPDPVVKPKVAAPGKWKTVEDPTGSYELFRKSFDSNHFEEGTEYVSFLGPNGKPIPAKVIKKGDNGESLLVQDLSGNQIALGSSDLQNVNYSPYSKSKFDLQKNKVYEVTSDSPIFGGSEFFPEDLTLNAYGKALRPDDVNQMIHERYTIAELEQLNGAVLGHGSNSSSLLAFTEYGGKKGSLIPTGQMEKQGKVPFSGEIIFGRSGVNQESVSTVLITEKKTLGQYSNMNGKGWSKFESQKKAVGNLFEKKPEKGSLLEEMQKNSAEVESLRRKQWKKLTPEERDLVQDPFPVIYGIEPKRSGSVHGVKSDVRYEMGLKDGATVDEIKSIFVPKDKIEYVKKLLLEKMGDKAKHIRVEDISMMQN